MSLKNKKIIIIKNIYLSIIMKMKMNTNHYIFIFFVFLLFFFLVEFIWFLSKPRTCSNTSKHIENFELTCVSKNIIALSELLINSKLDEDIILQQIKQIQFNPSEMNTLNPIIHSTLITSAEDKIENLKQCIMLNYIINCEGLNYNSTSKLNDIKYLNSKNKNIQTILNNRDLPSGKILEIVNILKNNIHT